MPDVFQNLDQSFTLFRSPGSPAWRAPQVAALGATLAQWSIAGSEPPLVSVPTGVGKTAIAMAAAYVAGAKRVLVVVPTSALRKQTAAQFRTLQTLKDVGALVGDDIALPSVVEVQGRDADWGRFDEIDVAVAIPASISPVHFDQAPPPADLFDLVIVDEAHHAPARTWMAILDHFDSKALLLTATPHRRDGRRLPGRLVYYFPLRQALDEDLYQPIVPALLTVPEGASKEAIDGLVLSETVRQLQLPEHASSQFIVRAATKQRAESLAGAYGNAGYEIPVLHSGLGGARQKEIVELLVQGAYRGVAMVGMLVEGFDLPSLRIAAYHDKHKSLEPTAQLMGRLARVSAEFPQAAVLVAALDTDTYPELRGALRELYEEDADWAAVLPGVIDDLVEADRENSEYARSFHGGNGVVDEATIFPLRRATVFEATAGVADLVSFTGGQIPEGCRVGEMFARRPVLYAGVSPDCRTLMLVTGAPSSPPWHHGEGLEAMEYELHLLSYRTGPTLQDSDLVFINTDGRRAQTALIETAGLTDKLRPGDPDRVQAIIDTMEHQSVSSVGVRNGFGATRGAPTYKMFAGSSIESGLRDADTAQTALGHAMVQVADGNGSFTAGISTGKGKYWETRYSPLRLHDVFLDEIADRYWGPASPLSSRLLPSIRRGQRLTSWPQTDVLVALLDPVLLGRGWELLGIGPIDFAELHAGNDAVRSGAPVATSPDRLELSLSALVGGVLTMVWHGEIDLAGTVHPRSSELSLQRGYSGPVSLSEALTDCAPTILFVDGSSTRGFEFFASVGLDSTVPTGLLETKDWTGVDIKAETPATAAAKGLGRSIHEWVEEYLVARAKSGRHRWILNNDGAGEIADHIVIETLHNGQVKVELWHSKFAGGANPGVRVTDFEVVIAQAIKSRRWPTDRDFWGVLRKRFSGAQSPPLTLVDGSERLLRVALGLSPRWSHLAFNRRRPAVDVLIGIVQPGLGTAAFEQQLAAGQQSANQIAQLLTVFHDAVHSISDSVVLASP